MSLSNWLPSYLKPHLTIALNLIKTSKWVILAFVSSSSPVIEHSTILQSNPQQILSLLTVFTDKQTLISVHFSMHV